MKLIDLLPTVEKTEYNSKNINIEVVVNALGITFDSCYEHRCVIYDRIKAYWLMPRMCTDTMVGAAVYFFDDELIGYSNKVARKSDEDFFFISVESADKVLKFFLSLIDNNNFSIATTEQLSEEMEDIGFNVYYANSICSEKVFYVPTSEYVEVTNVFRYDYNHAYDQLEVKFADGTSKVISCNEILVPYCLRDEDE